MKQKEELESEMGAAILSKVSLESDTWVKTRRLWGTEALES